MTEIEAGDPHRETFESIRHDADGAEFWLARQLAPVLGYQDYRNFLAVVEKAKLACANAGFAPSDHFGDVTTMIGLAKGRTATDLGYPPVAVRRLSHRSER